MKESISASVNLRLDIATATHQGLTFGKCKKPGSSQQIISSESSSVMRDFFIIYSWNSPQILDFLFYQLPFTCLPCPSSHLFPLITSLAVPWASSTFPSFSNQPWTIYLPVAFFCSFLVCLYFCLCGSLYISYLIWFPSFSFVLVTRVFVSCCLFLLIGLPDHLSVCPFICL